MSTKIQSLRLQAFQHQHGRCWYCGVQMWHRSPEELPGISHKAAAQLRCTAEHLVAQCDGGRDVASNIVAACARCNHTRHQRKKPPAPDVYMRDVRSRVDRGSWHHSWVHRMGLIAANARSAKSPAKLS